MKSLFLAFMGGMIMSSFSSEKAVPAPKTINPLHAVHVSDAAGLLVNGTLDVSQFITNNGRLWAVCKLRGIIGGIGCELDCIVPVTVGDCDGGNRLTASGQQIGSTSTPRVHDCECLTITFESCVVNPTIGPSLTLNEEVLPCGVQDFPGDVLCCANRLIGTPGSSIYAICSCMNDMVPI